MLLSGERARDLFDERLSVWKEMVRCPDGICILPSFTLLSLSCKVVIFCSTPFVRIDSCNFSSSCEQRLIGQFADDGRWMAFADSFSGWISAWIARELRVTPSLWRASVTWIEFLQKCKLYYSSHCEETGADLKNFSQRCTAMWIFKKVRHIRIHSSRFYVEVRRSNGQNWI